MKDIRKFWFIKLLLYPLSIIYGMITDIRNFLYDKRFFKIKEFNIPVISIGNIVAGGTGKTPFTMLCVDLLGGQYNRLVIVSRGYGRDSKGLQIVSNGKGDIVSAEFGGDEPVMMARKYPHIPVIVSERRDKGIAMAIDTFKANLIVLDDAFQHRQVKREADLVVINCSQQLRTERMLPLGNLRENLKHLRRADCLILNKSQGTFDDEDLKLLNRYNNGPVFDCFFRPANLINASLIKIADLTELKDKSVYVFCAIAGPDKFIKMLKELDVQIRGFKFYPDHYFYCMSDYEQLLKEFKTSGAEYLITTEKDMVKIDQKHFKDINLVAATINGEVIETKSFLDKLNQFIDIKI